jgi:hypothetical protein
VSCWEKSLGDENDQQVISCSSRQVLESKSDESLRLYAQQHVFAGYLFRNLTREKQQNEQIILYQTSLYRLEPPSAK